WRYLGGNPTPTTGWLLTGNAGTDPTTNYVGTSDAQALSIRTNGAERINITSAGAVTINGPQANVNFRVASQGDANAIFLNGSNSRVGLGTNLPAERLHVEGNARITALAGAVNVNIGTGSGYGFVSADNNGTLGKLAAPPGTLDLWYRPAAPDNTYIRPVSNNNIRVYDSGQLYGFYYNGNTNRLANFNQTSYAPPANTWESGADGYSAAVIGWSNVQLNGNNLAAPAIPAETGPNQTYGYLGYVGDFNMGGAGVIRGSSVYGTVDDPGRVALFGRTTNNASYAACIGYSNVWIASYNYVDNSTASFNPPAAYAQLNITNSALGGTQVALRGYQNRATTAGNPGYSVGVQGVANSQNQDAFGVMGLAYCNTTTRAGGYFDALNYAGFSQAYAYVGTSFGGVNRKITGTSAVSEIIPTEKHGRIMLTCPEAPEYWYQDYGTVKLVNGRAHVDLDPILADIIVVNDEYPIRVFCTPVDMPEFNGVTVVNRTATGFDLVELNGGSHSGTLDYQIIVKPKTGFGEGRFPQAPGPAYLKADKEPLAAKA
ncbi:MAG: hypothetical protein RMM53_11635, partial [Bacteroidia bacterium]|nr:hypothetical protein [Bacteroidia bacterium]